MRFLLSPAFAGGERARMLLRPEAEFPLARQFRREGAPLGEVFAFLSGLYFRGKLAYARAFGEGIVITPNRGLVPVDTIIKRSDIEAFAEVDIDGNDPRYLTPLQRDLRRLPDEPVVLLGSLATNKYVEPLSRVLGERLLVPEGFAGRGDMSRGGLLLRHARAGRELQYVPIAEARRHGPRPPKLLRLDKAGIAAAARTACQQVLDSGAEGVCFVDARGEELARLGRGPADVAALIAGQPAERGVHAAFVGKRGVLLARGRGLKKRLAQAAAELSATLEGVGD